MVLIPIYMFIYDIDKRTLLLVNSKYEMKKLFVVFLNLQMTD